MIGRVQELKKSGRILYPLHKYGVNQLDKSSGSLGSSYSKIRPSSRFYRDPPNFSPTHRSHRRVIEPTSPCISPTPPSSPTLGGILIYISGALTTEAREYCVSYVRYTVCLRKSNANPTRISSARKSQFVPHSRKGGGSGAETPDRAIISLDALSGTSGN